MTDCNYNISNCYYFHNGKCNFKEGNLVILKDCQIKHYQDDRIEIESTKMR